VRFAIGRRTPDANLVGGFTNQPEYRLLWVNLVNSNPLDRAKASFRMLGIALHYLTDITQPMHAANIANIYGGGHDAIANDWRHSRYEEYAERLTGSGHLFDNYPPLTAEEMNIQGISRIDELYVRVARASKKVWLEDVKPIFLTKLPLDQEWGDEAKTAVLHSTHRAPVEVAKFLLYWAHGVPPPEQW
jgi:hypothetical protein